MPIIKIHWNGPFGERIYNLCDIIGTDCNDISPDVNRTPYPIVS